MNQSLVRKSTPYGRPTLPQKLVVCTGVLFHLPFVLTWTLMMSPFHRNNKYKTWKRILGDKIHHYFAERLNVRQLQWMMGSPRGVYETWAKDNKLPIVIDDVGKGCRLFWVGERRTDKIMLYFHGGAFIVPMGDFELSFWKFVKDELKRRDHDVGLAVLNYSLVPGAKFPTQLHQAVLAVRYLLGTGLSPSRIQLVGDSAGGNLILQLISHTLHPIRYVPSLILLEPFAGVYLMSPWVSLTADAGSMVINDDSDTISVRAFLYWGSLVLDGVPADGLPYLEAANVPKDWFSGIHHVTERILMSAGDRECLRDEIIRCGRWLCKAHKQARVVLQDYGVHDDPHMDFLLPVRAKRKDSDPKVKVGPLTALIISWLADGWIS